MTTVPSALARVCTLALAVLAVSCSKDSPTSPSDTPTSTTTVAAEPIYNEQFIGKVGVSGSSFYSFTVTQYGTVNITLTNIDGAFVPPTVTVGLGIGVPSGEGCTTSSTVNAKAGSSAQISGTYAAGVYCAEVFDIGNLFAPANFAVSIAYP